MRKYKYPRDTIPKIKRKKRIQKVLAKMMLHLKTCLSGSINSLYRKQVISGVFAMLYMIKFQLLVLGQKNHSMSITCLVLQMPSLAMVSQLISVVTRY